MKIIFGMNQSLDGYVDHMAFAPGPTLFRLVAHDPVGEDVIRLTCVPA